MDALLAATDAYDGAKRPTAATKVGSAAASFTETYDRDGNVTSEGRTLAGVSGDAGTGTQAFSYDGLARVTAGAGLATALAYSYDRDGNRLTRTAAGVTTTYSYDRTGALISRVDGGTTTYDAYDGYGTLTSYASAVNQVTTVAVDLGDRVTSVTRPGGGNATTSFTLDALGRVASRTLPGAPVETTSYLGTSDTVSALASSVGTTSSALDPTGHRVANAAGGSTGFLLADLHGNQGAVVNSAESALTSASRYDPFGATAATWDPGTGVPTPWRFQGRWDLLADQSDPLYAAGARAYLPATAAFTSLDSYPGSVANPTSLNRYLYGEANPWTLIDPSGHYVLKGTDPDGSGTWVAETSEIFWQQRATEVLTTYTTDQYEDSNQAVQDWLVANAGQQAWQWVMDPANNPYTNPFAIELAWDYGLYADPRLAQLRHGELAVRLNDIPLGDQDAARRNAAPGNTGWLDITLTALLTAPYVGIGDMDARIGGVRVGAQPRQFGGGGISTGRRSIAGQIARGHAFEKHAAEFPGIETKEDFEALIHGVMTSPSTQIRVLSRGRTGYYDPRSGTIVIRNPLDPDAGTAFRPTGDAAAYFGRLR